jgi:hypothetical protein
VIMADLKTNYVDDVLDTTKNQLRKYQQIQNDDGTVSFVDVTEYTQVGTSFGAKDINDTNAAINDVNGKLDTVTEAIVHDNITGIFTYTRIGHMCIGCGTLTTTNDIDAYSTIVSNLPQTYTGNPYPGAFVAEDNTYNDFYINGSAIVNRKPVSKGHILRLSCVYMCQ